MKVVCNEYISLPIPDGLSIENVKFCGRFEKVSSHVFFDWPSFSLEFDVPQKEVNLFFKSEGLNLLKFSSEVKVSVDQKRNFTLPDQISSTTLALRSSYTKITLLNSAQRQISLKITKINDSDDGALCFYGSDYQLPKSASQKVKTKMLVIGDELCCGTGARPFKGRACSSLQNDSSSTFVSLLSDSLNIEMQVVAQKNIGVVRNKNDIVFPNDDLSATQLWKQINGGDKNENYDLSFFKPDIVLVAVGSNDFWDVGVLNPKTKTVPPPYYGELNEKVRTPSEEISASSEGVSRGSEEEKERCDVAVKTAENVEVEILGTLLHENPTEKIPTQKKSKSMELLNRTENDGLCADDVKRENERLGEVKQLPSVIDDFIVDDESDLDQVFTEKCEMLLKDIVSVYKNTKICVVVGPVMAREGEVGWKDAIENFNKSAQEKVVLLDCQLCFDEQNKSCWGVDRNPSVLGHKAIFEKIFPNFSNLIN